MVSENILKKYLKIQSKKNWTFLCMQLSQILIGKIGLFSQYLQAFQPLPLFKAWLEFYGIVYGTKELKKNLDRGTTLYSFSWGIWKKIWKNSKNNIDCANLALNVDIFQKIAFLCFQLLFWAFLGFLWLSLASKNLVQLINTDLDHWNKKNQFSWWNTGTWGPEPA